ncbi:MAG: DUF4363 domain-containing protein [Cyanobacteria bacterium CRU_2_1]|nr:DUF4363 domain-containing protein [Cyanobacteria bacterium RU_5_0]NJR59251.1 DUF4363 domain-containing protein [Cyanobacteria bacterium CRU_2_1]
MRFKFALLLCAIGLFSLAGCTQPPASSDSGSTEPISVSVAPASPSTSTQDGYPQLLSVVSKTQAAVEANDFAKAQQEFDQFEEVWSQVEDGIQEKSSETYDAIEQDMEQVTAALRASQSDQAIAALQKMNDHIQNIPQS